MDKNLTIKDKIIAFIQAMNIRKIDFFEATGIQSSNFKGKNMASQPGGDMLVKILTLYPNLSAEWLMRGEGNMLKDDSNEVVQPPQKTENEPQKDKESTPPSNTELFGQLLAEMNKKDSMVRDQAEEIGRLREQVRQLKIERGKDASDAITSTSANVG